MQEAIFPLNGCVPLPRGNPARQNPWPPFLRPLPRCPTCGAELSPESEIFLDGQGRAIGCQGCLRPGTAGDWFPAWFDG